MDTPRPNELTCQELVELVTDYLEGALSPAERARFDLHLRDCDPCVEYIDEVRLTIGILGRLTPADLPSPVREVMLAQFRVWKQLPESVPGQG